MKKFLATLALVIFVLLYALNAAAVQPPAMQLRVAIPKLTLWSEPTNKSTPVKDVDGKKVSLRCGDIVYEISDLFGSEYMYVSDENGNKGYVAKQYLVYGYKILLQGGYSQNIYRTEWAARYGDKGIGSVVAYRNNEELLVIGETTGCFQVLTVAEPEAISGYLPDLACYAYVYDYEQQ